MLADKVGPAVERLEAPLATNIATADMLITSGLLRGVPKAGTDNIAG